MIDKNLLAVKAVGLSNAIEKFFNDATGAVGRLDLVINDPEIRDLPGAQGLAERDIIYIKNALERLRKAYDLNEVNFYAAQEKE